MVPLTVTKTEQPSIILMTPEIMLDPGGMTKVAVELIVRLGQLLPGPSVWQSPLASVPSHCPPKNGVPKNCKAVGFVIRMPVVPGSPLATQMEVSFVGVGLGVKVLVLGLSIAWKVDCPEGAMGDWALLHEMPIRTELRTIKRDKNLFISSPSKELGLFKPPENGSTLKPYETPNK